MKTLHSKEEFEQAAAGARPACFVWSAAWCPDCVYLKPHLPALEKNNPDVDFYFLDRDELLDLAIEQEILGIPSLLLWQNGQEKARFVSKLRKTPEEIQAFINQGKDENNG